MQVLGFSLSVESILVLLGALLFGVVSLFLARRLAQKVVQKESYQPELFAYAKTFLNICVTLSFATLVFLIGVSANFSALTLTVMFAMLLVLCVWLCTHLFAYSFSFLVQSAPKYTGMLLAVLYSAVVVICIVTFRHLGYMPSVVTIFLMLAPLYVIGILWPFVIWNKYKDRAFLFLGITFCIPLCAFIMLLGIFAMYTPFAYNALLFMSMFFVGAMTVLFFFYAIGTIINRHTLPWQVVEENKKHFSVQQQLLRRK